MSAALNPDDPSGQEHLQWKVSLANRPKTQDPFEEMMKMCMPTQTFTAKAAGASPSAAATPNSQDARNMIENVRYTCLACTANALIQNNPDSKLVLQHKYTDRTDDNLARRLRSIGLAGDYTENIASAEHEARSDKIDSELNANGFEYDGFLVYLWKHIRHWICYIRFECDAEEWQVASMLRMDEGVIAAFIRRQMPPDFLRHCAYQLLVAIMQAISPEHAELHCQLIQQLVEYYKQALRESDNHGASGTDNDDASDDEEVSFPSMELARAVEEIKEKLDNLIDESSVRLPRDFDAATALPDEKDPYVTTLNNICFERFVSLNSTNLLEFVLYQHGADTMYDVAKDLALRYLQTPEFPDVIRDIYHLASDYGMQCTVDLSYNFADYPQRFPNSRATSSLPLRWSRLAVRLIISRRRLDRARESCTPRFLRLYALIPTAQEIATMLKNPAIPKRNPPAGSIFKAVIDPRKAIHSYACSNCGVLSFIRNHGPTCQQRRLLACAGCRVAHYCSRECQVIHWKRAHRNVCKSTGSCRLNFRLRDRNFNLFLFNKNSYNTQCGDLLVHKRQDSQPPFDNTCLNDFQSQPKIV